jgi:dolichyl-phosphate beta-glucosyltransferase
MASADIELSLILPAYNERASIAATIESALAYFQTRGIPVEIIVAADGNDGTREVVREMATRLPCLKVIGREQRSGKGRGIREAVSLARGRIIGFADADNKVPIEEYNKIEYWLDQGYEVVAGSRALEQSKIERRQPWYRRIGSWGFGIFMRSLIDVPLRDTQCGFKFFQRDAALQLFRLQRIDGYMFDVEILALAYQIGYGVKEVPISWHDDADSRLQLFSGNLRNMLDIFKIRRYVSRFDVKARTVVIATEE